MALSTTKPAVPDKMSHDKILPLKNGDRLARTEFERRYTAMTHLGRKIGVSKNTKERVNGSPLVKVALMVA